VDLIARRLLPPKNSPSTHSISNGIPLFNPDLGCHPDESSFAFPGGTLGAPKFEDYGDRTIGHKWRSALLKKHPFVLVDGLILNASFMLLTRRYNPFPMRQIFLRSMSRLGDALRNV
jgi:hypothetical protein